MFFTFTSFHLLPIYPHFLSSSSIPVLTYSDVKNIDKSQLLHFPSIQFSFILYFSQWSDSLVETPYKWSCIAGRQKVGKLQHIYNMKKHILSLNFCVKARPWCGYWESVNFIFFHALYRTICPWTIDFRGITTEHDIIFPRRAGEKPTLGQSESICR